MNYEEKFPKYYKSKESNISKSNRKSKHKHQYEECLLQYDLVGYPHTELSSYCAVCGKIGDRFKENKSIVKDYRRTVDTPIGKCYSLISNEDLYEKYHDKLPVFFIGDAFNKYVSLENNNLQGE